MNKNVRIMLENVYRLFNQKFANDIKAWDNFIDFLAVDNDGSLFHKVRNNFQWLFEDNCLRGSVLEIYDPAMMKSDFYDHLGDMYFEKILKPAKPGKENSFLPSIVDVHNMLRMTLGETDASIKIIDPKVGSGRLLMAAHKLAPNALLFGVDTDMRALRIAHTNLAIHGIYAYLLNADVNVHDIELDSDNGLFNWQFANQWYPHLEKLKKKNGTVRSNNVDDMKKRHRKDGGAIILAKME